MIVTGSSEIWSIHQFANDWITADCSDGRQNVVLSPSSCKLTHRDEVGAFLQDQALPEPRTSGTFWAEWVLEPSGHFRRKVKR